MADDIKPWEKYAGTAPTQAGSGGDTAPWQQYAAQAPQSQEAAPTDVPQAAQPAATPAQQLSLRQQLGRSLGLAARMPLQAAGSTAGVIGDALNTAINMGGQAIGHNPNLGMPSHAIQQGIDAITPTPTGFGEKAADFVGSTLAGGIGRGVDPLARLATSNFTGATAKALTQREQVLAEAQRAGYQVTPSKSEGGILGTFFEGLAGKRQLALQARNNNQTVTNRVATEAANLPEGAGLEPVFLKSAMDATYTNGYEPIAAAGNITTGRVYRQALDKVLNDFQGASRSFPAAARDEVRGLVDGYRVPNYDSGDAIKTIQILRRNATAAYRNGNPDIAQAHNGIAKALEDNIELNLASRGEPGAEMLSQFREARKTMAKQNLLQKVLDRASGNIDASKIGAQYQKGAPLTDGLDLIGKFAKTVPSLAGLPQDMSVAPTVMGGVPTAITGLIAGPAAGAAMAAAPIGRAGLRAFMLSPMGQRMIGPQLDPGILARLSQSPDVLNALPTAVTQSGLYGPRN